MNLLSIYYVPGITEMFGRHFTSQQKLYEHNNPYSLQMWKQMQGDHMTAPGHAAGKKAKSC